MEGTNRNPEPVPGALVAGTMANMGLAILFSVALVVIIVVGTIELISRMLHPQRKTYACMLANGCPADPSELGLTADEVRFVTGDGSISPGWLIEGFKPDGPDIVVTHGWNSSRYTALPKAALLARFARRVVVYDMRGHGDATSPITHLGMTEHDDLRLVLEQLPPGGGQPLVLYGSSMGAGISVVAAAGNGRNPPAPVVGLILEGMYQYLMEPIVGHLRNHRLPSQPFAALACGYMGLRFGRVGGFDRAEHMKRLGCPLLLLHGTNDRVCKIESARQICDKAAQAELVEFEGADHGNLALYDEARYVEAIERFVQRIGHRTTVGHQLPSDVTMTPCG